MKSISNTNDVEIVVCARAENNQIKSMRWRERERNYAQIVFDCNRMVITCWNMFVYSTTIDDDDVGAHTHTYMRLARVLGKCQTMNVI